MKYDSVYPTLRTAAQARNRLGRELHRGYSAAMPGVCSLTRSSATDAAASKRMMSITIG